MEFALSDEQRMLSDVAQRFLTANAERPIARGCDDLARQDWSQFAELGWLALPFPESLGGLDGSAADVAVLAITLGQRYVLTPFIVTAVLGGTLGGLSKVGPTLIESVIAGEVRLAFAHEEDGDVQSRVVARKRGDGFELVGRKFQVLAAQLADQVFISATDKEAGQSLVFLAPRDTPGMVWMAYPMLDGVMAADLELDQVYLPADALVLQGEAADRAIEAAKDAATLAWLAEAVGVLESCLELCAEYLKQRVQFGQPIGSFQSLQHIMATMFVECQEARSVLYQALAHADDDQASRQDAISAAKVVIGQAIQLVSRYSIQLHGGYGMTDEYLISHQYRRLFVLEKLGGDIYEHLTRLSRTIFPEV